MPKVGGKRRKSRTHVDDAEAAARGTVGDGVKDRDIPRSLVVRSSVVTPALRLLIQDIRKLMSPYTALNLKEKSFNKTKDYSAVASQLSLTHLLSISQTKSNAVLRIGRFMNGPTLHFKILQYSLISQVKQSQKKPFESAVTLQTPPIVVLNNFGQSEENTVKLMRTTFQNMYPSINVKTVRLNECRRVVLFHMRKEDGLIEMRHYAIRATPVGVSRNVKKILQAKIPDLSSLQDISDFLGGGAVDGAVSDSDADEEYAKVVLPDRFGGRGNEKAQKSAIKLTEIGPRLNLELFKVESGLCEGDILFHKFESKTPEEALRIKQKVESQRLLKIQRRSQQEANVKRKLDDKEQKKRLKEAAKRQRTETAATNSKEASDEEEDEDIEESDDEESDEENSEVGAGADSEEGGVYSDDETGSNV